MDFEKNASSTSLLVSSIALTDSFYVVKGCIHTITFLQEKNRAFKIETTALLQLESQTVFKTCNLWTNTIIVQQTYYVTGTSLL